MPKETIKIDSKLLQPFREIAGILGISLAECVERELKDCVRDLDLENDGLQVIAERFIADTAYRSRERAEGIAERFEAFAIGAKLDGKPTGTVATKVVPTDDGWWDVEVNYLSPSAQRGWREITAFDDNDDEGEQWKE
jgi:hypothetical protein